jgi:DNA-binding GntR family transcriptional regulator
MEAAMVSIDHDRQAGGSHIAAIKAGSLREQVTRALEAALVAGELQPGEIYSAPALGERFNVSATPVREAMLDLVKEGFVEVVRNRGFRVVEMSEADLDQISQIRLLLEVPTMAQVALSISPAALDAMTPMADAIEEAAAHGDLIAYLDSDRLFHVELISTLANPRLTDLVDRLRRQARLFGLNDLVQSGRLVASAREHHELLILLRAGDAHATSELMRSHIKHTRGLWVGRDE